MTLQQYIIVPGGCLWAPWVSAGLSRKIANLQILVAATWPFPLALTKHSKRRPYVAEKGFFPFCLSIQTYKTFLLYICGGGGGGGGGGGVCVCVWWWGGGGGGGGDGV